VRPMIESATVTPVTLQQIDLPADFLDMVELTASDGSTSWPLARIAPAKQFEYYNNRALPPGIAYDSSKPQQYRILGDALVLSIVPATALTLTLDYYAKLLPISGDNATNWLMDSHSDAYLFGVMAHAWLHLQALDQYQTYRDLFLGALEQVAQAYPERARDIALSDVSAPWASGYVPGIYV
jgi:hypothetical protein